MSSIRKVINLPYILPKSIRKRILFFVLLLLAAMSTLIGLASFKDASHEIEEIFDARLAQSARILQALVLGIHETELSSTEEIKLQKAFENALLLEAESSVGHKYESKIAYQVWHGRQLIMHSSNSPEIPSHDLRPGFGRFFYTGYHWETFTLATHSNNSPFLLVVAEREDVRGELVDKVVLQTLIPELIGIPVLAVMIWLAIGWGLSPLKELTNQIKDKAPNNLKPVMLESPPTELEPIQNALNRLLNETEVMIAREQRFIADAAHELRTPLAVLKIHADNALNTRSEQERTHALKELDHGVNRATRIVSQLLTMARLDPDTTISNKKYTDLLESSRSALAELMPLAWKKEIELSLDVDEKLNWEAKLEDGGLEIILQNLISNAVKFSHEKASIEVSLEQNASFFVISVSDHGPGISSQNLTRATERFYRDGNEAGAGLGLSIVKRIAERHSGSIELSPTPLSGLTVKVSLSKGSSAKHSVRTAI